jgi:haloacid dehalogenase superfamily, subfamily IA, variant 3 with third motif having DD or ED/haloacid dehalogenase superfamily, subfamily IA, variant 1 with third motif having Dx(3-4)D or Dx(3-4)E
MKAERKKLANLSENDYYHIVYLNRQGDILYKACIFDLDGTLANTLNSIAFFANSALEKCGHNTIETSKYRFLVGNGADLLMHRMLNTACGEGNYSEDDVRKLRKTYDALYESDPTHIVTNYDGMQELIRELRQAGIKLAVLSNKPHNCTEAVVEALFAPGMFDACYGQRPEVARKPSPQGALLIAEELGVKPEDCLYIGDTDTDMKTGAAAGMDTVGVLWGFRPRQELEENHAKYIVETPKEIKDILMCGVR